MFSFSIQNGKTSRKDCMRIDYVKTYLKIESGRTLGQEIHLNCNEDSFPHAEQLENNFHLGT